SPEVAAKPQIVAANKMDAVDDPERVQALERRVKKEKLSFFKISAATGEGVDKLLEAAWKQIAGKVRPTASAKATAVEKADTTSESVDLIGAARRSARARRKA